MSEIDGSSRLDLVLLAKRGRGEGRGRPAGGMDGIDCQEIYYRIWRIMETQFKAWDTMNLMNYRR